MNTDTPVAPTRKNALLIVGSPRGKASTSLAFGRQLLRRLEPAGLAIEEMTVSEALRSTEDQHRLHKSFDTADLVVVSFPLYVDQLPAPLVQVLELVSERRKGLFGATPWPGPGVQKLVALVQCGFPETLQTRPAVDIVRQFARETGFGWAGALALGMGGAIGGKRLEKAGGVARNVHRALDIAAAALASGAGIPAEAARLLEKPLMPKWLYIIAANWGFRNEIKKQGARKRALDRPYA
jgi:hypothetical protein